MALSCILDRLISEEIQLKVRALSADPRKPLELEGVLIRYDGRGYLFKAKDKGETFDSNYYVPKEAVGFFKFELLEQKSGISDSTGSGSTYKVSGITYDSANSIISNGQQKSRVTGIYNNLIIEKLFRAGLYNTLPVDSFGSDLSGYKNSAGALRARVYRVRKILLDFNLTVKAVFGGYELRENS